MAGVQAAAGRRAALREGHQRLRGNRSFACSSVAPSIDFRWYDCFERGAQRIASAYLSLIPHYQHRQRRRRRSRVCRARRPSWLRSSLVVSFLPASPRGHRRCRRLQAPHDDFRARCHRSTCCHADATRGPAGSRPSFAFALVLVSWPDVGPRLFLRPPLTTSYTTTTIATLARCRKRHEQQRGARQEDDGL